MPRTPEADRSRHHVLLLAATCAVVLALPALALLKNSGLGPDPEVLRAALAALFVLPMLVAGWLAWRTRDDADELERRIRADSALITQNVTLVVVGTAAVWQTVARDSLPAFDASTLSIAYVWLVLGSGWLSARRYR